MATERSARDEDAYGASQLARLRRVAHAAVEQCGRAVVPEIGGVESLAAALAGTGSGQLFPGELRIALDPSGAAPDRLVALDAFREPELAAGPDAAPRLALFVGPEGGWSPDELAAFEGAGVGRLALGERILRVETAAIVAAGLALATFR